MSRWIRRVKEPLGAMPKGLLQKIVIVFGSLVAALVILTSPGSDEEAEQLREAPAEQAEAQGGETVAASAELAVERLRDRAERAAALREADLEARRRAAAAAAATRIPGQAPLAAAPGDPEPETPEAQLREELRLEDIRRAHAALRSPPVALSLRAAAGTPAAEPGNVLAAPPAPEPPAASPALPASPAELAGLAELAELEALAAAGGVPEPAEAAPTPTTRPRDPAGWERVFEGQMLEAVLATQLRGDFDGPAVALVSSPLWSRDRQRVLIARGTRAIGTAGRVGAWDQARLAVAFRRLIFPDNTYLRLEFTGLDQSGAAGLQDRVNRHYLSTLGAAGAVGLLSGLTLRGSRPYEGGMAGARAGAGIGLGRGAETILDRYLNRLPTITIRAGTRMRILFTSDALVPRPTFRPQLVSH